MPQLTTNTQKFLEYFESLAAADIASEDISNPICIFDSGVGGISIYKAIKNLLPGENYIYLADKKFFPYGTKHPGVIRKRTSAIVNWFQLQNAKLIVIACNTATVEALEYLREMHPNVPIVGTVPVIKTCAEQTKTGNIGIMCTEKTAKSKYQKDLIKKFAKDFNVHVEVCPYLVEIIEKGDIENIKTSPFLHRPLNRLKSKNIDTLALGCSHFPLVGYEIQKIAGRKIRVLDSGRAIARQVKRILERNLSLVSDKKTGETRFYTTAYTQKFDRIVNRYVHGRIKSRLVDI